MQTGASRQSQLAARTRIPGRNGQAIWNRLAVQRLRVEAACAAEVGVVVSTLLLGFDRLLGAGGQPDGQVARLALTNLLITLRDSSDAFRRNGPIRKRHPYQATLVRGDLAYSAAVGRPSSVSDPRQLRSGAV